MINFARYLAFALAGILLLVLIGWMVTTQLTAGKPSYAVTAAKSTASPSPTPMSPQQVAANNLCRVIRICTGARVVYGPFPSLYHGDPATAWFAITDTVAANGTPFELGWTLYTSNDTGEFLDAE